MALNGMQWQELAVLTRELQSIRNSKPKSERSAEDEAIVKYFKLRLETLEKEKSNRSN